MGHGTPEEYAHTEDTVMSALHRLANRQRAKRVAIFDKDGLLLNDARTPYLVNPNPGKSTRPGYYLRHFDEERNRNDQFVVRFIDADIAQTEEFKTSLTKIRVSYAYFFVLFNSFLFFETVVVKSLNCFSSRNKIAISIYAAIMYHVTTFFSLLIIQFSKGC